MIEMHAVESPADIAVVAALAHDIWRQHYVPIIGLAQTDYMVAKFQSAAAIARQMTEGYRYYLARKDGVDVGYFALVPDFRESRALLSKLYVRPEQQGAGIGKAIIAFVEAQCAALGIQELWLTVNRNNTGSIAFYKRTGFTVAETLVQDIGNGFVMDDYKMVKALRRV
jgi:GNAT superfamily N-acetyltransferase